MHIIWTTHNGSTHFNAGKSIANHLITVLTKVGNTTFWIILPVLAIMQYRDAIANLVPDSLHKREIGGNITLSITGYMVQNIPPRREPFSWYMAGTPELKYRSLVVPISFVVGESDRSFRQPFNQVGASPRLKNQKIHLGYRNVFFSPYVLAGVTMLGAGTELQLKGIRVGFMGGRISRAVEENTGSARSENWLTPAYKRNGYGVRFGFGSEKDFIDLVYFKSEDDPASLQNRPESVAVTPSENAAGGITIRQTLSNQVRLEADGAVSLLTRDVTAPKIDGDDNPQFNNLNSIIQRNITTNAYFASGAALHYTNKNLGLGFSYRRIEPDYQSHGAYFFNNDVESYRIEPSSYFMKRKLFVKAVAGTQKDNLFGQKGATTRRSIYSGLLTVTPKPSLGFDILYANFGTAQTNGRVVLTDTTRMKQLNRHFTFSARYSQFSTQMGHVFSWITQYQVVDDRNPFTSDLLSADILLSSLSYSLLLLKSQINVTSGIYYAEFSGSFLKNKTAGPSLSVSRPLLNKKLLAQVSASYSAGLNANTQNKNDLFTFIRLSYKLDRKNTVTYHASWLNSISESSINLPVNELKNEFRYDYRLR